MENVPFDKDTQLLLKISALWKQGEKQKAFDLLMGMLKKDPDNALLNAQAAEYLNEVGKVSESDVYIQKAIEHDTESMMNPYMHIIKARMLAERGLIHDAVSIVHETLKRDIREFLSIKSAASILRDHGLLDDAEKVYLRGLEIMPKHEDFWKDYAEMYKKAGMLDKFLEVLQKGVESRKRDTHLWSELCRTAAYSGKSELAWDALENTKKFMKDNLLDNVRMGLAYAALEEYEKAKEFMEKAVNLDKKNQISWVYLAQVLVLQGDKKGADNAYKAAEKVDKKKKDLVNAFKAMSMIKSDEFIMSHNAETKFKAFLSEFKSKADMTTLAKSLMAVHRISNADWLINKSLDYIEENELKKGVLDITSLVLHAMEEHKKSIGSFYYATQLYPDEIGLWNNLGGILAKLNKMHGAHAAWKKCMSIDDSDKTIKRNLGILSTQLNYWDDAIKYLDGTSNDRDDVYALGMSYAFTNNFEKAKEYSLKMIEIKNDDASAYGLLAIAEVGLGNNDAFNEAMKKCKKLDKNAAKEFKKILEQATSG